MTDRQLKMSKELIKIANEYLNSISNRTSLITITRADIAPNFKNASLYISVFPDDKEEAALVFLERKTRDMYDFLKSRIKGKVVPRITFIKDEGEKNRQRIDLLV
ncbi:MAG: ribosome-binding factor A [Candidatus Pacebacteria bacterium]|nr:ribosome-binding factor A [Candidatus Paceibacterota bacterium]MCD8507829.1 ribosome-binding factor A [Candidatus Paceibacterota bacterium]MCD8527856.1 ribosome-binding factor A [Candidatus Paceibacterota bacterium]MCD8563573.1 ribosome-binding factor A [Candidatus Paceibacterota bacterium]